MKVLIVDDDTQLLDTLSYVLRREGYEIVTAADGQRALKRWRTEGPDIVLVGGSPPKIDGFSLCRQIHQAANTPVIILSELQTEEDCVRGLLLGADDFITKPFGMRELCARMKAVLRRSQANGHQSPTNQVRLGDLVINPQSHQVLKHGTPIRITRIESRILALLAENAGEVVPHRRLVEYAWGYQDEGSSQLLKTHICHLRRKLRQHCNHDVSIESMVNVGYRLVARVEITQDSQPGLNPLATSIQPSPFLALSSMG